MIITIGCYVPSRGFDRYEYSESGRVYASPKPKSMELLLPYHYFNTTY